MIDLNKLCEVSLANATQRMNNGAHIDTETRKMLKHIATEVVETAEAYCELKEAIKLHEAIANESNLKPEQIATLSYNTAKAHFASEMADIICCVLIMAGKEGIDIEDAISKCIEKNRLRAEGKGDKK